MSALRLDIEDFLRRYWQREPLLLRGALPGFTPPLSADELAGLAMEADAESRIIREVNGDWQVNHGPFSAAQLQQGGAWTLLVQAVDQWLPEVAALRELVDFLPTWRLDDIMVSYASDRGSVGPHFDHYDVFLLQGEGERLWRLGQHCDEHSPLLPGQSLRILASFDTRAEYLLGPGDMLYVPPGVAHWGIARGECTTFSIGLRAPRQAQMLERWVDQRLAALPADRFFSDRGRSAESAPPGRIGEADIARARAQLASMLADQLAPDWFGELVTEPRYDCPPAPVDAARLLANGGALRRQEGARLAWREADGELVAYANGAHCAAPPALRAPLLALCGDGHCDWPAGNTGAELLHFLIDTGAVYDE